MYDGRFIQVLSACPSKIVNTVIKIRISRCWEVCFKHLRNRQALSTTHPRAHLQAIPQRGVLLHSPCIYCRFAAPCSLVTLQRGVLWQCCQIFQIAPVPPRLPPGSMELLVPCHHSCHHSSALPSYVIVMLDLGEQLPLYWGDVLLPLSHSHWAVFWKTYFHAPAIYAYSLYQATGTETFCWSEVGGLWFWL